ncbi:hypothetical protein BN1708_018223, partial [Verticillium longisporum]
QREDRLCADWAVHHKRNCQQPAELGRQVQPRQGRHPRPDAQRTQRPRLPAAHPRRGSRECLLCRRQHAPRHPTKRPTSGWLRSFAASTLRTTSQLPPSALLPMSTSN